MDKIITEITPLEEKDCFYLVDRNKEVFDYPLHKHEELELTFEENCEGTRRIVGDSIESLGKFDLALIGSNLEHTWEQNVGQSRQMREVTIQFSPELFSDNLLNKDQMASIHQLLERAHNGMAFGMNAIMRIYAKINEVAQAKPGFYRFIKLLEILHELSLEDDYHILASNSFAHTKQTPDSRRVRKVEEYIDLHFKEEIRLQTVSDLAGMTPTAFSRFFKLRTGKTLSDYIIDIRLGYAARQLVDTTTSVVEICYESGFNNVSNFNRIFKKRKGCSPTTFRENYHKNKILV